MDMDEKSRRQLLLYSATLVSAEVAGCSSDSPAQTNTPADKETPPTERPGTTRGNDSSPQKTHSAPLTTEQTEHSTNMTQPSDLMSRTAVRDSVESRLAEAKDKSLKITGIEPLVSEKFFETDINNINPDPGSNDWTLQITGTVENEQTYTFDDLASFDPQHRFMSLRCVGESLIMSVVVSYRCSPPPGVAITGKQLQQTL